MNNNLFYLYLYNLVTDKFQFEHSGKDDSSYTTHPHVCKYRRKICPTTIWKGSEATETPIRNTISYGINHFTEYNYGNKYPPEEKLHMMVAKKVTSGGKATNKVLEEVIIPGVGVEDRNNRAILNDNFKSYDSIP